MRKQTKLVAVLSAAALLAIGASMTSFAATGWQEENGTWVYYDKDENQVTDKWEKSGNRWFYLNGDGEMSIDTLIDDGTNYYYVGTDGAMVANGWVSVANEQAGEEDEPDANWYYFQASGKAYKASSGGSTSFKTINGKKYAFQDDAKMLYGWVGETSNRELGDTDWTNGLYFCGDENDGAQATGWAQISVIDDTKDEEDQNYWFNFSTSNGKKVKANASKSINGKKYAFDENGVMQSEWFETLASGATATPPVAGYKYFNDPADGHRLQKGWIKAVPAKEVNEKANDDESLKWYYADGSGNIYNSAIKTVNSKKYAFNEKGEMLSGLWALKVNEGKISEYFEIDNADKMDDVKKTTYDEFDVYYFGGGDDGSAKTGNQTVDVDGDTYSYTFGNTGSTKYVGLDGIDSKKTSLYVRGQKIKADKDMRYESFDKNGDVKAGAIGGYLLNTSGSLMKNKTNLKDTDDFYYSTDLNGVVDFYSQTKETK